MGVPFDYAPERPEHIDAILNGLDRYNPETTTVFQDYVAQQCESQTYDCYANLALLKLYQFNPHLTRDETTTNILVKALTVFPGPDFSLCLSLLPPHSLKPNPAADSLAEAVQKLAALDSLLNNAQYDQFWSSLDGDDLYADLIADVQGFEDLTRVRMAVVISQSMQSVDKTLLGAWLNVKDESFDHFVKEVCGWTVEGETVTIPLNKENEARGTVVRENVKFDQFSRMIKRAYEQPA
ncbi:hypothetical protein AAFC00_004133 [Neodothiora populina]|uniref:Eukaryotic translation initiation factor 3 subunit K n=1 Tax=Neodothiora populina TaxID=2781224 RepID=A0ABR3PIM9_9PEZI